MHHGPTQMDKISNTLERFLTDPSLSHSQDVDSTRYKPYSPQKKFAIVSESSPAALASSSKHLENNSKNEPNSPKERTKEENKSHPSGLHNSTAVDHSPRTIRRIKR